MAEAPPRVFDRAQAGGAFQRPPQHLTTDRAEARAPRLEHGAARLELDQLLAAKEVHLLGEGEVQHVRDVVLQHPAQVLVVLRVHRLDVLRRKQQTAANLPGPLLSSLESPSLDGLQARPELTSDNRKASPRMRASNTGKNRPCFPTAMTTLLASMQGMQHMPCRQQVHNVIATSARAGKGRLINAQQAAMDCAPQQARSTIGGSIWKGERLAQATHLMQHLRGGA